MEFFVFIIIVAALIFYFSYANANKAEKFCTQCGHEGPPVSRTKGSIFIEIVLWLCIIVPGLVYSIWRHTTTSDVCAECGSESVIPPDSPMAHKLRKQLAEV